MFNLAGALGVSFGLANTICNWLNLGLTTVTILGLLSGVASGAAIALAAAKELLKKSVSSAVIY